MVAEPALARGALVRALDGWSVPGAPVWALCLPGTSREPRVRAFLDTAREVCHELGL